VAGRSTRTRIGGRTPRTDNAEWPDPLTHLLDEERRLRFQGDRYYDSTRYLTLLYLPPRDVTNRIAEWFYEGGEDVSTSYGEQLAAFTKTRDDIAHLLAGHLERDPHPLGRGDLHLFARLRLAEDSTG
jgi:type IV secretory pathway VirB4 component